MDGGLFFGVRFLLDTIPIRGQYLMFDIKFMPAGMDPATEANLDARDAWLRARHYPLLNPKDTVMGVSKLYLSGGAID